DESEGAVGFSSIPVTPSPDTRCPDSFPSLSGEREPVLSAGGGGGGGGGSVQYRGNTRFNMTEENFPALHGGAPNQTFNISLQRGTSQRPTTNNLGTVAPRSADSSKGPAASTPRKAEVTKLSEQFSSSCKTSAHSNGPSKVSSTKNSTTPTPKPAKSPPVETEENKPGGAKVKKKKTKSQQQNNSPSPLPTAQSSTTTTSPSTNKKNTPSQASTTTGAKAKVVEARKCSELKIGELRGDQSTTPRAPPAPSLGPPPGFGPSVAVSPPPGFSVTLNSVARQVNGLTFTNSCGQSFPIRQTAGVFQPPANFEQRNSALVQRISQALHERMLSGGLSKFRQLSSQFRQGDIDASELWRSHGLQGELEECRTCGQVVRSPDARAHLSSHVLDSHFPALSDQPPPAVSWPLPRK
ncbi:hypothetical protein B566_EDAN013352, partial [Ephemera danica]